MKKLLVTLFLFISFLGFGQQVNAPDPKEFTVNTSGQDASGFTLSGFNSTATLLCAIGLPTAPTGTTFYFSTTSGVTASTGYTMSGNKTRISFTGTMANINNVLASMKINTTGTAGDISISVSATVNPTGYYYLPTNGHFYRPMSGFTGVTAFSGTSVTAYNNLKTYCTQQSFKGQTGYLMTITSSDEDNFVVNNVPGNNIIFALTDNVTEGRFVIDAGPENGTVVRINSTNQTGQYNNWASGEPNNWGPGEDYVVTKWNGSQWNDFGPEATAFPGGLGGYVIEFGTWSNPDDQTFTDFYNNSVVHYNGVNNNLKSQFTINFGGNIDETKFSAALHKRNDATSAWTANSNVALNGVGRVTLSTQLDTAKVFSSAISIAAANDMTQYSESDIGKIYKMTITGNTGGGAIWGTNIYTNDSYIPKAAVHAGIVTAGQTKEVYIKIVEGQNDYPSTTQNGVTSDVWGAWGLSYQFVANPTAYKATITPGQVEWSYTNPNASWLGSGKSRLLIDMRQVNVDPTKITHTKIFDAYDGVMTYTSHDPNGWAIYTVPSPLTKITDGTSAYNSYIRNVNGWNTDYAFQSTITLSQQGTYKQHKFVFQDYDSVQLKSLYNSIVTVSDVYLAFKEYSEAGGLFGGGSGTQFGYGIQFKNADVDGNNVFDERDCFRLLQNLTGARDLVSSYVLDSTMKIVLDSTYGTIGKSNWQQFPSYLGKEYSFSLLEGKTNYSYNLAVTWKGDVNLSHSATPPANGITNMSANFGERVQSMSVSVPMNATIMTELSGDSVYVEIAFNPGDNNIVGTQFQLNYDNSLLKYNKTEYIVNGSPTNYSANKGTFINVGSLNTDGSQITSATYKVLFTTTQKLNGGLGLISVGNSEAVNKDGKSLGVKIK
jgi:hypothetical protein